MKNYLNYITAALFLGLTVFASCGGSDDPDPVDPRDAQAALLTGTAGLAENGAQTPSGATVLVWTDLVVTISGSATGGSITTTGSADPTVWPASSTWTFSNELGTKIMRSDDVEMTLVALTETTLTVSFSIAAPAAKAGVVAGTWQFTFTYQ